MDIRPLPSWSYRNAELVETRNVFGVRRHLYKLPDAVRIHEVNSPVYFYHYEPSSVRKDRSLKKGLVISYPLLGGKMVFKDDGTSEFKDKLSQFVAYYCTQVHGANSIVVATDNKAIFNPSYTPHDIKMELENVVLNHKQVHDFIKNSGWFENIDVTKVHHIGMSLGALTSILVVAFTQWYNSLSAVVGGAPLADIMAYSEERLVKDYFEGAMWNMDLTREKLIKKLQEKLGTIDTEEAIQMIETDKLRLVVALFDDSVPNNIFKKDEPNTGFNLAKLAGNPKTHKFPLTHKGTILAIPYLLWTIGNHMKKHGGI